MTTSITIRFITESDCISDAIRVETWCAFSHTEFVLEDGTLLGAHAKGGVQIRAADYCRPSDEEQYKLPVSEVQKEAILAYARLQVGKPYDFTDIVGILAHRDWRCDDKWICSELVAAAFEQGGFSLLNSPIKQVNRISPRDVYLSPYLIGQRIFPIAA